MIILFTSDYSSLHSKKLSRLAECPGQVERVPRVGGLPCLAGKRFNAFSKETYEKLAGAPSLPPCKQAQVWTEWFWKRSFSKTMTSR